MQRALLSLALGVLLLGGGVADAVAVVSLSTQPDVAPQAVSTVAPAPLPPVAAEPVAAPVQREPQRAVPEEPELVTVSEPQVALDERREPASPSSARTPLASVHFASEGFDLDEEAVATLARLVRTLPPDARLRVEGHADPSGRPEGHRYFSQQRARAVMRVLVEHGLPRGAVEAVGLGADFPVTSERDARARAMNRRADVFLVEPRS